MVMHKDTRTCVFNRSTEMWQIGVSGLVDERGCEELQWDFTANRNPFHCKGNMVLINGSSCMLQVII